MFCPVIELNRLPMAELDVLRRFWTQHVRGMSRQDDKRLRRFVRRLFTAQAGEGFKFYLEEERSGPFHNRHRVILEKLFHSQERFRHIDKLHDWLKLGGGFCTWEPGKDSKPVAIPRSTSFPECSEDEMREAHAAMVDFLHEPRSQRFLWKHLKPDARAEMVETILAPPEGPQQ
jgi:hypothetical protein